MSWLDFIGNIGTNIKEGMGNVANKIRYANAPQIQPLQMAENGGIDAQKTLELALAQPKTWGERLGGRTVNVDFENSNPETGEIEVNRISKYQPGLLNDIRSGAKENFATGFAAPNWEQTITPDGRKKGMGYRFGEGLGSFARFAESPLGRGLIMAGIVGASGGSGLEALGYGAGAGLGNQQARMKDSIYRNSLIEQGQNSLRNTPGFANLDPAEQQAQLDRIANQVNSYRGYLGDDTYKQVLAGMQLRDNAEYRNALLAGQRKDQEMAIQQRQAELQQKTLSDAADRALKSRELDIKEKQAIGKPLSDTQVKNVKDLADSLNEVNEIIAKYSNSKYDAGFGVVGAVRRNPLTSKFDPLASEMRQDIDLFRKTVARAKEGGRLTDQDQKYYEKAVLNPNLTRADFLSLANEFKNKMERQYDTALDMYELQGKNVNNFRNYYENNQTTTNEGWAF